MIAGLAPFYPMRTACPARVTGAKMVPQPPTSKKGSAVAAEHDQDIEAILASHLTAELGDPALGRELTKILMEDALSWRAPTVPLEGVRTIIGFTFGNRMLPSGNREPGPVNAALADIAVRLHVATSAPVHAQWEVAEAVGDRIPATALMPIYPGRDAQHEPRYLSTGGVIEEILARNGGDRGGARHRRHRRGPGPCLALCCHLPPPRPPGRPARRLAHARPLRQELRPALDPRPPGLPPPRPPLPRPRSTRRADQGGWMKQCVDLERGLPHEDATMPAVAGPVSVGAVSPPSRT